MRRPGRPLRDGEVVDVGGLAVRLKINPRARRIILRIDTRRREAVAVAPSARGLADAARFAASHAAWFAERLAASPAAAAPPAPVTAAVRRQALTAFQARIAVHCHALGARPPRLAVTDTRSRWGSCSPARPGRPASIRLSWRLALAPPEVADYVVAHECAHLIEANHGPRFWALVRGLVGDERPHRRWLRAHGAELHGM